jgi:uncharacterized protein (DUF2141 family)
MGIWTTMTVSTSSRIIATAFCTAAAFAAPLAFAPAGAETGEAPGECVGDLAGKGWLNVEIRGVRNSTGLVAITIYDGNRSDKFLRSKGSLDVVRVPAQSGTTRACVKLPGSGVYAIAVYHDEDSSRKLTRSGIGLPTEGYGFSNNPPTIASLPTFSSVRLNVPKPGLTARITLKYP